MEIAPKRRRRSAIERPSTMLGYVRVSTVGQAVSGLGIAAQLHVLKEAARLRGLELSDDAIYADEGVSGSAMAKRAGLQAAFVELRAGRAGGLVVCKLDRLGRNTRDVLAIADEAQRDGWRLVILDLDLDTASPMGRLTLTVLAAVAEMERRTIGERQIVKHDELRRKGRPRGRQATARDLADRILAERSSGATWQAIADALNAQGIPTARGGKMWRPASTHSAANTRQRELDAQDGAAA